MAYPDETIRRYLADAASDRPAPGGGSVSALAGALACGMGEMAANFTAGRDKYAEVEQRVRSCLQKLQAARQELTSLVQADVEAYTALSEAYGLPRRTEEERAARAEAVQKALRGALEVPLRIMRRCAAAGRAGEELVRIANPNLITDVGVCAVLAEAACAAASLNVEINLKYIKDESLQQEVRGEVGELSRTVRRCREAVSEHVKRKLES